MPHQSAVSARLHLDRQDQFGVAVVVVDEFSCKLGLVFTKTLTTSTSSRGFRVKLGESHVIDLDGGGSPLNRGVRTPPKTIKLVILVCSAA